MRTRRSRARRRRETRHGKQPTGWWLTAGAAAVPLIPTTARAHDATVLVWALGPAVLATPLVVAVLKRIALRRWTGSDGPRWWPILGLAVVELIVWLVLAPLGTGIHIAGRWVPQPGLALAIPLALAVTYALNRLLMRSSLAKTPRGTLPRGTHARLVALAGLTPLCALGLGLAGFGILALLG